LYAVCSQVQGFPPSSLVLGKRRSMAPVLAKDRAARDGGGGG
jgi:hypothetical protein